MASSDIPIITIDGPTGVGKGTVSRTLAQQLGWHYLDSGVLYRILAYLALTHHLDEQHYAELLQMFAGQAIAMDLDQASGELLVHCQGEEISQALRTESCSQMSSRLSAIPTVREALLARQRSFAILPGLVADGRDMGTVIFPDATLKIYLDASVQERAERRYKQLKLKGIHVSLDAVLAELEVRDHRDRTREVAPLKPAEDAHVIDTTHMSVDQVCEAVMALLPH